MGIRSVMVTGDNLDGSRHRIEAGVDDFRRKRRRKTNNTSRRSRLACMIAMTGDGRRRTGAAQADVGLAMNTDDGGARGGNMVDLDSTRQADRSRRHRQQLHVPVAR
jgi:high-affinity K+ transport system ATPase subunit B